MGKTWQHAKIKILNFIKIRIILNSHILYHHKDSNLPKLLNYQIYFQTGLSHVWISAEMTTRKVIKILTSTFIIVTITNAVVTIYISRYHLDKGAVIRISNCVKQCIIN